MKKIFFILILVSVPVFLMVQAVQGFRYASVLEKIDNYTLLQEERLEENQRLLAGIAVFNAPERVFQVGKEALGLESAEPDKVLQVFLSEDDEEGIDE